MRAPEMNANTEKRTTFCLIIECFAMEATAVPSIART